LEVIVAREDGKRGGRVCEEEGSRRGVDVFEFSVEGGRTRFARKKVKKAGGGLKLAVAVQPSSSTKGAFCRRGCGQWYTSEERSGYEIKKIGLSIQPPAKVSCSGSNGVFPRIKIHR
jgi:hypothetical protein